MRWTGVIVGTLALALDTVSLARAQGLVIARNPSQVLVLASPATDPSLSDPDIGPFGGASDRGRLR